MMKNNTMMTAIGRGFHGLTLHCKKHSPVIFVSVGVVGTVVSAVMACRATTKIGALMAQQKKDIETISSYAESPEKDESYTEADMEKDLSIVRVKTAVAVVKLYLPAVVLGVLSLTSIVLSHHILSKRNAAIAAAFTAVDKEFGEYRKRVVDRFGEAVDRQLKYNLVSKEVEETVVDEDGNEKTVTKTVEIADENQYSAYARFFDESSEAWEKDSDYNRMFLQAQQEYANDLLHARGHLFLNEVYDMLGLERSKAGQVVGWVYDPTDKNQPQKHVDFGIYDVHRNSRRAAFVNGYERSVLLDFNVDGNILDFI